MLFEILKKGKKRYYIEYNDDFFSKKKVVDSNAKQLTPLVDKIRVVDGLFFITDHFYISDDEYYSNNDFKVTLYFYVNTDGLPASPCYINYFPDKMYVLPVKTNKQFLKYYDHFKEELSKELSEQIQVKLSETKVTCFELARLGKSRKKQRGKKK